MQGIVDKSLGNWPILTPYSMIDGRVVVIQGETVPGGYSLSRSPNGKVTVTTDHGSFPGLISGSFGLTDDCPDVVAISHDDLNKDAPERPRFQEAANLAIQQTRHEWCRLVSLVNQRYGTNGVNFIFNSWVNDRDIATRTCTGPQPQPPEQPQPCDPSVQSCEPQPPEP